MDGRTVSARVGDDELLLNHPGRRLTGGAAHSHRRIQQLTRNGDDVAKFNAEPG
jgi:hypothetical protein